MHTTVGTVEQYLRLVMLLAVLLIPCGNAVLVMVEASAYQVVLTI